MKEEGILERDAEESTNYLLLKMSRERCGGSE